MGLTDDLQANVEACRQEVNEVEFWFARELQEQFGYKTWESFERVILKAAENARIVEGVSEDDHFRQVTKKVAIGSGAERLVTDYVLSRYGAYLLALNADGTKPNVAYLKNYFVVQTRKQELVEQRVLDSERLESRMQLKGTEKALNSIFFERGLDGRQIAAVRAQGDSALFGGNTTQQMKEKYGITKSRPLSDFLPSVTIAAKTLVNEMTKLNIEANDTTGEGAIAHEHVQNSTSVRSMLGERGIRPEDLPPEEDINKVGRRLEKHERELTAAPDLSNVPDPN